LGYIAMAIIGAWQGVIGLQEIDVPIILILGQPEIPNPFIF
jgi:hypothetical protein